MGNLLQTGAAWLRDELKAHAGTLVTYTQGATVVAGLTATKGRTVFEQRTESATIRSEVIDWLISAADLGLTPARGDRISDGVNTYQVLPPNAEAQEWQFADPFGQVLRIHTRIVS